MSKVHGKKKKKSFYQRVKKFGQQGNYGKGRSLSKEEYSHFLNIFELLRRLDGAEKDNLIRSILRNMVEEDKVKDLATNQIVSRILDDILPHASVEQILPIMNVFSEDLRVMCADPFASHVLQTLLTIGLKFIQKEAKHRNPDRSNEEQDEFIPVEENTKIDFESFICKTAKFVYNNLENFIHESYASHILRTVMEVCSGVEVSNSVKCSGKAQTFHSIKGDSKQVLVVPDSLATIWLEILDRLKQLPNFTDIITSECGSPVLQTAFMTLSAKQDTDRISGLVSHIIEHGFLKLSNPEDSQIHPLFECNATCRLMEVIVPVVSVKQQELIYGAFFKEHLSKLVKHEIANFSVQRLFSSWKSKESFPTLYETHSECLEEAFSCGHHGVIYSFVQSCRNLNSCQSRCVRTLMKMLNCFEPEDSQLTFGPLLIYFLKLEDFEKKKLSNELPPLSLYGTLIVQELLRFNKPIKVVRSILEMPSSQLVKMMSDPRGSHVTEVFMSSPIVGEASKAKLISKLEGNFVTLARSKHGSYSLESLWNASNVKTKTTISEELFESSDRLKENQFGIIIYNKFQLRYFNKQDKKNWEELQRKECNRREFLKRMLDETAGEADLPLKKKKKKGSK